MTVNTVVSLKDPFTGQRIKTPARFADTPGLVSFDLHTFLASAERSRKWQCPHRCAGACVPGLAHALQTVLQGCTSSTLERSMGCSQRTCRTPPGRDGGTVLQGLDAAVPPSRPAVMRSGCWNVLSSVKPGIQCC